VRLLRYAASCVVEVLTLVAAVPLFVVVVLGTGATYVTAVALEPVLAFYDRQRDYRARLREQA
jgi:hypothetical protein